MIGPSEEHVAVDSTGGFGAGLENGREEEPMRIESQHRRWSVLPVLATLILGVALFGCPGTDSGPDETATASEPDLPAGGADERGVIAAHKALIAAMESGDAAAVTALMDPSSSLLIFHPLVEDRFDGIGEVDEGLGTMFGRFGSVSWTEAHATLDMEGNVAWMTSHVLIKTPETPAPFVGRGTEVWVFRPGGWRLTHAHWSENAEVAGSPNDQD